MEAGGVKIAKSYKTTLSVINPTTIFVLCIYFLQYKTSLFRIHVLRTRRLIHTPSLSWLKNLNFKFGAMRHEKRRAWPFIPERLV